MFLHLLAFDVVEEVEVTHGKKDSLVKDDFVVTDSAGNLITGIPPSAFTKKLYNPSGTEVSGTITVTITELGLGNYRASFTPNVIGDWLLVIAHATYFSYGKRENYLISETLFDDIPTVSEIDTQLSSTHGDGSWEEVPGPGEGANPVTITVRDVDTLVPIPSALVQVRNLGETVLLAMLETDVNGQCGFLLDNGTYKVRLRKLGSYTFTNPKTLVVSGSTSAIYTGSVFSPGTPSSPELCLVYSWEQSLQGVGLAVEVKAKVTGTRNFLKTNPRIMGTEKTTTSDDGADGYWSLSLIRSVEFVEEKTVEYEFYIGGEKVGKGVVPDQASISLRELLGF